MPARLTIHLPSRPAGVRWLEEGRTYLLGREPGCDLFLEDKRLSRCHARFSYEGCWRIEDLASTNGTAVEGRPVVGPTPLGRQSWLNFGGLLTAFEETTADHVRALADQRRRRWQSFDELQHALQPTLGLGRLLERTIDQVLRLAGAERGAVLLADEDGVLDLKASRSITKEGLYEEQFSGSVGALKRVVETRRTVAAGDAFESTWLAERASVQRNSIRALVCMPLVALDSLVGVVYADSTCPGKAFTEVDVEVLEVLCSHAALAIAAARLDEELRSVVAELDDDPPAAEAPPCASGLPWTPEATAGSSPEVIR